MAQFEKFGYYEKEITQDIEFDDLEKNEGAKKKKKSNLNMNENSKENNGKYSEPGKHYGAKKRKCFIFYK